MLKILYLILIGLSFWSCDDQTVLSDDGNQGNSDLTPEGIILEVDASSLTTWVYYSFSNHSFIEPENPESNLEWDIAFQRYHFRTNSGLSGSGRGGAYVDSINKWDNQSWLSFDELDFDANFVIDGWVDTFYDLDSHEYVEGISNSSLEIHL